MLKKCLVMICALSLLCACFHMPAAAAELDAEPPRELKLLFFGNSFTFSTLGYLPQLLEEAMPGVQVTMGIAYASGCSLAKHADFFQQNTPYTVYAEYATDKGQWSSHKEILTPKMLLLRYNWDIIGLQQSVENLHDFDSLKVFADLISDWIDYPTTFVFNMGQARHANDPSVLSVMFPELPDGESRSIAHCRYIAYYAQRAKESGVVREVLPCATAVQNLRTIPAVKELGDAGYLAYDDAGHLHHGLGMLTASYAACCKLLEMLGETPRIYDLNYTPSDEFVQESHFVGNGSSCVGITPENMMLAKKCALLACADPYEVTNCASLAVPLYEK